MKQRTTTKTSNNGHVNNNNPDADGATPSQTPNEPSHRNQRGGGGVGRRARIVKYEDAPRYLQDNPWIRSGYRIEHSFVECLRSLFHFRHNETGNIWSHFLGLWFFFVVTFYTLFRFHFHEELAAVASWEDEAVFLLFLVCTQFCMAMSTCYHLFMCHSAEAYVVCIRMDLSGISAMITGSFYPTIYYIFASAPSWRFFYLATISLFAILSIAGPFLPAFHTARFRKTRVMLYGSMALFGLMPTVHTVLLHDWSVASGIIGRLCVMFASYIAGLTFYATKFPEKWWPGRFDIWFHSHQWWHVFGFLGALAQFWAALHCFNTRHLLCPSCF
ncbi:Adiponectin receptor protein 2 [Balamuthia mandrillaris]